VTDEKTTCLPEAGTAEVVETAWPSGAGTAGVLMANSSLMAEAVAPLEYEMVERYRIVPAWTSLPDDGSTDSL
jgi:hypothetical protein